MNRLEDDLRNALCRESPPEGFARRVLAKAAEEIPAGRSRFSLPMLLHSPGFRFAAVALCFLLTAAGMDYWNGMRERERGEAAKEQLMWSLRVTGSKLQRAQQKVLQIQASRNYRN